jgi:hypothetical protein
MPGLRRKARGFSQKDLKTPEVRRKNIRHIEAYRDL